MKFCRTGTSTILPTLRTDFELIENWVPDLEAKVACPILAFRGSEDRTADKTAIEAWRNATTGSFESLQLPGDHFYLAGSRRLLIEAIVDRLTAALSAERSATSQSPGEGSPRSVIS